MAKNHPIILWGRLTYKVTFCVFTCYLGVGYLVDTTEIGQGKKIIQIIAQQCPSAGG